ncbi:hypothetical protein AB0392_43625 [Nonomuraea angiospora]|uniref:hypothetical protein n=1 Tax=Nonomuraea angiospora TaxID=46172 RepID=UPI00345091DB
MGAELENALVIARRFPPFLVLGRNRTGTERPGIESRCRAVSARCTDATDSPDAHEPELLNVLGVTDCVPAATAHVAGRHESPDIRHAADIAPVERALIILAELAPQMSVARQVVRVARAELP